MTHDLEDRLREAFAYRSDHTEIHTDSGRVGQPDATVRHRLPAMLTVVAAGVLVVGGLVAVNATRTGPSSPTVPLASLPQANLTPIDVTADAVSLDGWIAPSANDAPQPSWTVLDVAALPDGVELVNEVGGVLLIPPLDPPTEETSDMPASHQYRAELRDVNNDISFAVGVSSSQIGPCTSFIEDMEAARADQAGSGVDDASVDINGINAAVSGSLVCWMAIPGVIASVEASSPGDVETSIALARQLTFTDVEQLPQPDSSAEPGAGPASAEFSGTLSGAPWAAVVSPSSLRTMTTYIDGRMSGAFENDRLSQPTDTPVGAGEMSLDASPGRGAIAYGYTAPEVLTVRAINSNAESLVLATFPRELETFFAVPIPVGVTIDKLEFLRADGSVYASASIGPLPRDLEGGYGGIVTILRSPAPDD